MMNDSRQLRTDLGFLASMGTHLNFLIKEVLAFPNLKRSQRLIQEITLKLQCEYTLQPQIQNFDKVLNNSVWKIPSKPLTLYLM